MLAFLNDFFYFIGHPYNVTAIILCGYLLSNFKIVLVIKI